MKDFINSKELKNALGSFFKNYYNDQELLEGLLKGLSMNHRQLEQNLDELRGCASVSTTPTHHIENWYPIVLRIDRESGSYHPLTYGDLKALYGQKGESPVYDRLFNYGDSVYYRGLRPDNVDIANVTLLCDGIDNPSTILVEGVDYRVTDGGAVIFTRELLDYETIKENIDLDLFTNEDLVTLWGYNVSFDLKYLAQQWGYLVNYEKASSKQYNRVLWNLWRSRYYGMSSEIFKDLLSIYLKSPICKTSAEIVEKIYSHKNGSVVITSANVYHLDSTDTPVVSEGDILNPGDNIGSRFQTYLPTSGVYTHQVKVNKYADEAAIITGTDTDVTIAKYVVFEANKTPVEFDRNKIKYGTVTTEDGVTTFPVSKLYRFDAKHLALEIKETAFTGTSQQEGAIQLYSSEGEPLLVEPFSGSILPNKGTLYLYSDKKSLLKYWENAEDHRALIIRRILLIGLYPDYELSHIQSYIEGIKLTNGVYLGVDIITSEILLDVLNEFSTKDTGIINSFKDYDLLIVDALSGVVSHTDNNGELSGPENLLSSVEQERLVEKVDSKILKLQEEITKLDNDLLLALSHNYELGSLAVDSLYGLAGILGVPSVNSEDGEVFYSEGKFSLLDTQKIVESEKHNDEDLSIPTSSSYRSGRFKGKEVSTALTAVHSLPVEVSSETPELIKELDPNYEYVYSIRDIKNVD